MALQFVACTPQTLEEFEGVDTVKRRKNSRYQKDIMGDLSFAFFHRLLHLIQRLVHKRCGQWQLAAILMRVWNSWREFVTTNVNCKHSDRSASVERICKHWKVTKNSHAYSTRYFLTLHRSGRTHNQWKNQLIDCCECFLRPGSSYKWLAWWTEWQRWASFQIFCDASPPFH